MTRVLLLQVMWIVLCSSSLYAYSHESTFLVPASGKPIDLDFFQSQTVKGKVTDETGSGMPGVNVVIKGTSNGTTTDAEGSYVLNLTNEQASGTLVFSFIGYSNQEQPINNRTSIDVSMVVNAQQLSEVVVVGYGVQEKRDVTAAIASINGEAISKIATTNALEGMKGQVAGVDVQSYSGRPGSTPSILIRGRRSLNASNDPLFVVDGIPVGSGTTTGTDSENSTRVPPIPAGATLTSGSNPLNDFNPADIASIEVLKDAAATAIYGSRGANGVVLITTKRGKAGKTSVSYSGYYGVTQPFKTIDVMDGEEFAALKREANRLDKPGGAVGRAAWGNTGSVFSPDGGPTGTFRDPIELANATNPDGVKGTDWQDLIFKNGSQMDHNVSVNGGNEKTQFNMGVGYFKQEGTITGMDFTKYTARVNLDQQISKRFRAGMSNNFTHSLDNNNIGSALSEAVNQSPLGDPYEADGVTPRFQPIGDGIRSNPLSELVKGKRIDETKTDRIFSSAYAEVGLIEGLKYKLLAGIDLRYTTRGIFEGQFTNNVKNGEPRAIYQNQSNIGYTIENLLTYNKTSGDHNFGLTGLFSVQENKYENHYASVQGLPYEKQKWFNLGTAGTISALRSRYEPWALMSGMGRINYAYKGKYLLQASLRTDGSSRLAEGHQWTSFPGGSIGWRIKDEEFMSGIGVISDLKLRGSYGVVGNTSIEPYRTQGVLKKSIYSWGKDGNAAGFALDQIPSKELGWEKNKTVDVGLDFGLFNGRLSGSFDYYVTNNTGLLLQRNVPPSIGYDFAFSNIGATRVNGFEIFLQANILNTTSGFTWDMDFNAAHYKEQIVDLAQRDANGNKVSDTGNKWFIGQPLRVFYDYEKIGIWQASEVEEAAKYGAFPGEIKVKDKVVEVDPNNPAKYKAIGPDDRVILGNDIPSLYGGLNNRFGFKGFDLSFFLYYRLGYTIDSQFSGDQATMQGRYNNIDVDYWTIDNPTNAYPRPNFAQESPAYGSTLRYFDGGFVKLRTVSLGYNLPKSVISSLKMTNFRIYFTAQNVFAITKYKLMDPESPDSIGAGDVPSNKLFMGGVNLTF
jgi:TonB-linked SusC/RagA family outer membrane protein